MTVGGQWRAWAIAAVLAAAAGWMAAHLPEPLPAVVKPRQDAWRLAPLPRRLDQTATAAMVSGAGYWGALPVVPGAAAALPSPDPRWRVAAVYGHGTARGVLIEFADATRPPQRLGPGDALPSGHRIVSIGDRELCVRIGGKAYRLGVERSAS